MRLFSSFDPFHIIFFHLVRSHDIQMTAFSANSFALFKKTIFHYLEVDADDQAFLKVI